MILHPPFRLHSTEGTALGTERRTLEVLGIQSATLKLRSLAADELSFTLRDNGRIPAIPATDDWLTLTDDTGAVLFTGVCKVGYQHPEKIHRVAALNAYQGLIETPLLDGDRAYLAYGAQDYTLTILDLLHRAAAAGLPISAPALEQMPAGYLIPKMAHRSSSYASALEDVLKFAPDMATRMDYTTTPPTLRFYSRSQSTPHLLNLYSSASHATGVDLTPQPEARALSVAFAYSRRDGDDLVQYLVQQAGDDSAEARRKVSIYLSGQERTDMFVSEALTTAQKAVAMAQASVDAVGASIDAAAASAQIALTWSSLYPRDANLAAAVVAEPAFTMSPAGGSRTVYTGIGCGGGGAWTITSTVSKSGVSLKTAGGSAATGWYPIETGSFTPADLTTAGATKETRYIDGWLLADWSAGSAGMTSLISAAPADTAQLSGYSQAYVADCGSTSLYFKRYGWYQINLAVDAIDMAPSAVAAAVKAAAGSGSSAFIERAEFVEAPDDLAANYFSRQDWTPYKGPVQFSPLARDLPEPGDFLSIVGEGVPTDWPTMATPVSELSLHLPTRTATAQLGHPPRMDFSSLLDRLRIPPEDNYEPG